MASPMPIAAQIASCNLQIPADRRPCRKSWPLSLSIGQGSVQPARRIGFDDMCDFDRFPSYFPNRRGQGDFQTVFESLILLQRTSWCLRMAW